jgi:hypothetical protein
VPTHKKTEEFPFPAKPAYTEAAVSNTNTPLEPEEKRGLLDKIKEKMPGHKKTEEVPPSEFDSTENVVSHKGEPVVKKGMMEKIKEKLPGHRPQI